MCAANQFHTPVLLQEAITYLLSTENGIFVDATLGGGGHTQAILERISPESCVVAFDVDDDAIARASDVLKGYKERCIIIRSNFRMMKQELEKRGISSIQGVLFDLGVSSYQIDQPSKGFSFQTDAPLDMRMDQRLPLKASDIVNTYDEKSLTQLFREYGEERESKKIARAIVTYRLLMPIQTTRQLAMVIERVSPQRFLTKTLARIFQSLRIEVNRELENLKIALKDSIDLLQPKGRIVVISYHSLEDRIVKDMFRRESGQFSSQNKFITETIQPRLRILTKKPLTPSEDEVMNNPRARSAKMRVAEKL